MSDKDKIEPIVWRLLREAGANGLSTADAIKRIQSRTPWAKSTVTNKWYDIIGENLHKIKKVGYAKYALAEFEGEESERDHQFTKQKDSSKSNSPEKSYYQPFAEFLIKKKICSEATSTYGTRVLGEWHNPDVIGFKKFKNKQARTAIITVEIKSVTKAAEVIKGFGQSCAYKLFSHQVYLVVPNTIEDEIEDRLLALCVQHNIGLVLFDPNKKAEDLEHKDWEIKNLPVSQDPNYAYVDLIGKKYSKGSENSKVIKLLDRYDII